MRRPVRYFNFYNPSTPSSSSSSKQTAKEMGAEDSDLRRAARFTRNMGGLLHILLKVQDCTTHSKKGKGICCEELRAWMKLLNRPGIRQQNWILLNGDNRETLRWICSIVVGVETALLRHYADVIKSREVIALA